MAKTTAERFWAKVDKAGPDGCWLWTACVSRGYGNFSIDGRSVSAHRWAYELLVGPIPAGMVLDHICHNGSGCLGGQGCIHRRCVNPSHLELTTPLENLRRGVPANTNRVLVTHCPSGHEYTEANTYRNAGRRFCRTCNNLRGRIPRGGADVAHAKV